MKTSDLDDKEVLRVVYESCLRRNAWTHTDEVVKAFPDVPRKIVASKLSRLLDRGLLTGCDCGCRGDWELTYAAYELLGLPVWRDNPAEYFINIGLVGRGESNE